MQKKKPVEGSVFAGKIGGAKKQHGRGKKIVLHKPPKS